MPGMGRALQTNDPTITAAFHAALLHQLLVILVLIVVLALAWNTIRTVRYRRSLAAGTVGGTAPARWPYPEPPARRVLRITFGVLWVFDGLLQAQASMPLGLPGTVLTPAASSSPGWVQHIANVGATIWSNHPVSAAAATVWIQIGLGVFLLVAPRGYWSRVAGGASVGWGLVVWVFGEAFGGIVGHGSSWLFGSPGAAVFYIVAGALLALADSAWERPILGKRLLGGIGVLFIGMGVLQAWPGRGFWNGQPHPSTTPGALTLMAKQMAQISQPAFFSSLVRSFGSFDAAHGWSVNLVAVLCLLGIGLCFVSGDRRLLRIGVLAGATVCVLDWIFVEDLGFFGGVGTDPNSMIPMASLFIVGYLAVVRLPVPAQGDLETTLATVPDVPWLARQLDRLSPSYLLRCLAAIGAVGILLVGAAPMALASTNPNADPILAEATDGTPNLVDYPAPSFTLTDQGGQEVSLKDLSGHTLVVTFLDPVCTSDCPLIAQELRVADGMLGPNASGVDLVAIVNNPLYNSTALTNAFDRQEGLDHLTNWKFLTGSLPALHQVWTDYGVQTAVSPAGAMIAHGDTVFIIDRNGQVREILSSVPGASTASYSSFSGLVSNQVLRIAHS